MWWIGLALAIDAKGQHPQPLPERTGCERYEGTASGNDPTVRVVLLLCTDGDAVTGELQWSSLNSGWNVRQIAGQVEKGGYALKDVAVLRERPNPGWRFCTVDRYQLTRSGTSLSGPYASKACEDEGTLELTRMATDAPPPAGVPQGSVVVPATGPSTEWACVVASGAPVSGGLMLLAIAALRPGRG